MGPLDDIVKCKLYEKFYQRKKTLFKKDPLEYWRECRRYLERHFSYELGEALKNGINEGSVYVDSKRPADPEKEHK